MGREYRIEFQNFPEFPGMAELPPLDNPISATGWASFEVTKDESGFYFCDHANSAASAVAFKRLIDVALTANHKVAINEL